MKHTRWHNILYFSKKNLLLTHRTLSTLRNIYQKVYLTSYSNIHLQLVNSVFNVNLSSFIMQGSKERKTLDSGQTGEVGH